jgi:uncharacterized protein involved in outer membrane biogenesis
MLESTADKKDPNMSPKHWRRFLLNRWMLTAAGAVVLYALLGFFLAPWLFKRYVSNYAEKKLARKAAMVELRVNPFLFTVDAKEFVFEEADGRPILGFGRLFIDFELSSLFRWAWTFADIRIEQPSLHAEIQLDGRLNLLSISDNLPKPEAPPSTDRPPPRLVVQHAEVVDGSFTFSDRSDPTPATAIFAPLNLEFKKISTLPDRKGPYTIHANLPGGGTVGWRGEVSLHPIFSEGELSVDGFKLVKAWEFAQDELNIDAPSGEMDFSTRYRFDYRDRSVLLVLQAAKCALKGLALTEKGKDSPILALETIELTGMGFDLKSQEFSVPNITVRNGKISASVDEKGVLNWQKLVAPQEHRGVISSVPENSTAPTRPWHLKADSVNVENVALDFTDRSRTNPLALAVGGVNIFLNASAEVGMGPLKAIVDGLDINLSRIALSEAGDPTPFISFDALALNDGRIDMESREITIMGMAATGGETRVVRSNDGEIRWVELLAPSDRGMVKREIIETGEKARTEGKPWSFKLDALELKDFTVSLKDQTFTPPLVYDLKDIRTSLMNVSNDKKTPIDFAAQLKIAQGGIVTAKGQISQPADKADVRVKIKGINLKPLEPALEKFTVLKLESGDVSASTRLKYRSSKSGPQLRASGSVGVDSFKLSEADGGERFLEWKAMSANGLKFELSPRRLEIEELRIQEPGAKIVIFEDRSVNLAKLLKRPDSVDTQPAPKTDQPPAPMPSSDPTLFPVNIERVRIDNGVVDFADLSLVLPFITQVTDFNGAAAGISSDPARRTSLKFEGKVDPYGLATMAGSLSPFAPKAFTDITVSFLNVEMKPLSPYTATFAGRRIASGTLNLNLKYKIQDSELLGGNDVVLEQFTLGDRVDAPNAINLPIDLAIALLSDAEGKIDVSVPVGGNLDNPEFSYGHVIRQAIVNLITKIVTAPFRALGGLLGDKGQQMDAIAFNPGSDRLLPPEMKKLKKVSEALEKRPRLGLVVQGRFDPEVDGEALRTERVQRALAEEMGAKPGPDETPAPLALDNAKTQRALEKLIEIRLGKTAADDFKSQYEISTGEKAKPVKPYLAFFGWESSDTAYYQAMFKELVKREPLSDNDLQNLAQRRRETIIQTLRTTAALDPARVSAGSLGPVEKASTKTVNTKLTLDALKPRE